jgi:biotin carboxylase
MVNRIVIVGCGFPQMVLIRRARALGLHVIGADLNPRAIGVRDCHEFAEVSTTDVEGLAALVARTGAGSITTTGSERALTATAAVAAKLNLPFYADTKTVRRCQEKDAMREGYARGYVKVPAFAACTRADEARAFARAHGYPLVVKPSRGWGQRGVARVDSDDELAIAFDDARAQSESAGLAVVVVEEWLIGREYSVNGWIEDGTLVSYCVTERITVPGKRPLGVMVAEVYPSGLMARDEATVVAEARRGARALGHMRGPCYSQVVFDDARGAYLLETAARLGGGFDADVTFLASGVDLYTRVLGCATGNAEWEHAGVTGPAYGGAIAKFIIGTPGRVARISGLDEARRLAGVVDADVFVPVGDVVHPLTDGSKRAGFALAHGATRDEAMARADYALTTVSVITETIVDNANPQIRRHDPSI